jgi:hypothetical protein
MYNPKDILTEDGYDEYKAHLKNIENGLFYIQNHADDLHLFNDDFNDVCGKFEKILPLLKKGDGEKDETE